MAVPYLNVLPHVYSRGTRQPATLQELLGRTLDHPDAAVAAERLRLPLAAAGDELVLPPGDSRWPGPGVPVAAAVELELTAQLALLSDWAWLRQLVIALSLSAHGVHTVGDVALVRQLQVRRASLREHGHDRHPVELALSAVVDDLVDDLLVGLPSRASEVVTSTTLAPVLAAAVLHSQRYRRGREVADGLPVWMLSSMRAGVTCEQMADLAPEHTEDVARVREALAAARLDTHPDEPDSAGTWWTIHDHGTATILHDAHRLLTTRAASTGQAALEALPGRRVLRSASAVATTVPPWASRLVMPDGQVFQLGFALDERQAATLVQLYDTDAEGPYFQLPVAVRSARELAA